MINIQIKGNTIIFKSVHENYYKERSGLKPNTIRRFDTSAELGLVELFYEEWWSNAFPKKIQIIGLFRRDYQPVESFTRELTDITMFEGFWIFSWKPEPAL